MRRRYVRRSSELYRPGGPGRKPEWMLTREFKLMRHLRKTGARYEYLYQKVQQPFIVTFIQDDSQRLVRIDYPVARLFPDGTKRMVPWTVETLSKILRRRLEAFGREYGGVWRMEIEVNQAQENLRKL